MHLTIKARAVGLIKHLGPCGRSVAQDNS